MNTLNTKVNTGCIVVCYKSSSVCHINCQGIEGNVRGSIKPVTGVYSTNMCCNTQTFTLATDVRTIIFHRLTINCLFDNTEGRHRGVGSASDS